MFRTTDNFRQVERLMKSYEKQARYAAMQTVNDLANDFQRAEQEGVRQRFTLRQPRFILNTIKRERADWATRDNLRAAVRIDPQRDQLARHEEGGEKTSIQGKPYVAVPSPELRRTKRGLIPRRLYPSAFKPFVDLPSGITKGQQRSFIVPTDNGNRLLIQRTGKRTTKARYLFVPSVTIPPRLEFEQTAREVARSAAGPAFRRRFIAALRTAR